MGRNRSFDEDEVLDRAMHAFRRHGYAGLSIKRLEEETGLSSGSLYNAYGDKAGLYRAAMAYYVDGFVAGRIGAHAGPVAGLDDLEELFLSLFREPLTDGYGCLVTNAVLEFGPVGSPAADDVGRALDLVASGMRAVLAREIGPERAAVEADRLFLLYQGILVLSRADRLEAGFENAVRAQFEALKRARDDFGATRGKNLKEE